MIKESILTASLKKEIYDQFREYSLEQIGFDGLEEEPVSFELFEGEQRIAIAVVQIFWGALHLKYLLVEKEYRGSGIGRKLMDHVSEFGKAKNCPFIFVETLSFQGIEFYQKCGFQVELERKGYLKDQSFYYLKKDL